MTKPFYVLLEGPDGVSKTTLCNALAKKIQNTEVFFDPGISSSHEDWKVLRDFVKQKPMHSVTETLMFYTLRSELMNVIEGKLNNNINVVQDRGGVSTWVYQGYVKNQIELVENLDALMSFRKPHITILLTAPFEVLNERLVKRNNNIDKFKSSEDFRRKVYNGYSIYTSFHKNDKDFHIVDANRTEEEILNECVTIIKG